MPRDIDSPDYVRKLAQWNRAHPTLSHRILWRRLRRRELGVWFKQEEPMGRYVADFCAPKAKLVVEIDGGIHQTTVEYDHLRDQWMKSVGYQTLRVKTDDVEVNVEAVMKKINAVLSKGRF